MRQPQRRRNNNNNNVPLLVDYSQTRATLEIENQFKKNNKRTKKSSSNDSSRGGTPRRGRSPVKNTKPRRVRSGGSFGLRYLGVNSRPREPTINGPTDAETTALLELQNLPLDGEEEDRRKSSPGHIMFSVRLTSLGVDHLDDLQVSCSEMNLSCQCRRRMTRSSSSDDMMMSMSTMMENRRRSASLGPKRKSLRRIKSDNSCATTASSTATTTASGRTRQMPTLPIRSVSPLGGGSSHRRRSMSPPPQKAPSNSSLRSGSDHSRTTRGLSPSSDHERRQRQERRTSLKLSGLPSIAQESSTAVELEDASNRSLNLMMDASTNSLPATATPMSASFSKRRARFMNRSVSFEGSATGENSFSMTSSGGTTTTRRGGRRLSPKRSKSTTKDKLSSSFNLSASFNTSFRLGGGGDDSMRNSMNQSWTSMKSHDMNSSFSFISGSRIRIHTASQQVSPEAA